MLESKLQARIVKKLKSMGLMVRPVQWRQRPNCPDLVITGCTTVWLEVKTPTGRLRPGQKREIDEMRTAGAEVYVVRSLEEVDAIVWRHYPCTREGPEPPV
jgi:hypothetical protein